MPRPVAPSIAEPVNNFSLNGSVPAGQADTMMSLILQGQRQYAEMYNAMQLPSVQLEKFDGNVLEFWRYSRQVWRITHKTKQQDIPGFFSFVLGVLRRL